MAIFAIIALGVGFFAGLKVTKDAMHVTVKGYLDSHGFYDFRLLSTLGFQEENLEAFRTAEGVEAAEGAVNLDVLYQRQDGRQGVVKALSLTEEVNTVKLIRGRMPVKSDECVVDSRMPGEAAIGSVICLAEDNDPDTLDSFSHREYTIVGVVDSPLYIQFERGSTSLGTGRLEGFICLPPEGFTLDYYTEIYVRFSQDNALYSQGYQDFVDEKESVFESLCKTEGERRYEALLVQAEDEIAEGRQELADRRAEGEEELEEAARTLADARQEIAEGEQALTDARRELTDAEDTVERNKEELVRGQETLEQKERELSEGEAELAKGEEELSENRKKLEAGRLEIEKGRLQLLSAVSELEAKSGELEAQASRLTFAYRTGLLGEEEYRAACAQIEDYRQQIAAGRQSLSEGQAQIASLERQLAAGEQELAEGTEQLADARRKLREGRQALEDARKELEEGERQIREAEQELEEARSTLAEKEKELAEGKEEAARGEREYREARQEFEEKIREAEEELGDAEKKLAELEPPDTYVLGRNTNVGYVCFESDSSIVEGIANIFPVFFFLVAALVCVTTMNRMVEEQRTQIGVLKALGYGSGTIMSKYMIYSGAAAFLGCVCGFLLGTWAFPAIIWYVYGLMYSSIPIVYVFDWKLAAVSMLVSLLCSVGTTWLSCRVELAQVAAQLMRPKAPKAGKRVFLEKIPILWRHLSFLKKVSVRNIFRYKKRLFMMVLGISGCTALLVTGFGIKDSIAGVAAQQFTEIQIYDLGVSLKSAVDGDLERQLEELQSVGLENYLCVAETNMDIVTDKGVKSIYLVSGDPERMGEYLDMHTESGERIPYPSAGEGVLTNKLAKQYGIRPGDVIYLRDDEMNTLSVTVTGIMENFVYNYVYISPETWEQAFGTEPERRTVYVDLAEGADAHKLSAALMNLEQAASVTVNADTMKQIGTMMESLDIIVAVIIVCAGGLAFIVLYNLTNINITERVREIATVKVLGFYKKETAGYVFRENILLTVLGMLLGLVLGNFLHAFVMNEIQVDMIAFETRIKPLSFLYSGLLTLAFAGAVDRFMEGKLEGISMTESLKSVD